MVPYVGEYGWGTEHAKMGLEFRDKLILSVCPLLYFDLCSPKFVKVLTNSVNVLELNDESISSINYHDDDMQHLTVQPVISI